jgi:hypothetical protein
VLAQVVVKMFICAYSQWVNPFAPDQVFIGTAALRLWQPLPLLRPARS